MPGIFPVSYTHLDVYKRQAWETDQSAGEIYYSQFVKAFETREGYYLYIARQQAYVLGRDGFTRGDPEESRAFFEAAAGRPVKWQGPR